jgi:uncharacterized DUF497 family protein
MDVFCARERQCFVWDSEKAQSNLTKHGVSFEDGVDVFTDPFAVFEDATVAEEQREAAIGIDLVRRLLYLVHVVREDDCIRLISARVATGPERRRYEEFS